MSVKPLELRKIRKPLMEKKRRARINDSLDTLKQILLQNTVAIPTSGGRVAKLEKADILEMTVRYVQNLHRRLGMPVVADSVSSTTQDFEQYQESNKEIYKNLLKEINHPISYSHIARETIPKKELSTEVSFPYGFQTSEVDKENCDPRNFSNSKSKNFKVDLKSNKLHWRPW